MNVKINVLFEMSFATGGECKHSVSFDMPEHPDMTVPDSAKKLIVEEIKMLCDPMIAAITDAKSSNIVLSNTPAKKKDINDMDKAT